MTINVTATHANADYDSLLTDTPFTFTDSDFRICGNAASGYYAKVRALGCGKDAASPEAAIRSLLMDNGYTNICLSYPEPEPMISKEQAESLAIRYAAYTKTAYDDYLALAVSGQMLLDIMEATGIELMSPEAVTQRVEYARSKLDDHGNLIAA